MKLHITISKYHSRYLCQISLQIMLLPILILPCAQLILLVETDPDDPVSVTWIAFTGKLMGFRIKIFKKQFVCLLFSVCSFITLVENMIAASKSLILTCVSSFLFSVLLLASLLRRCQGMLYNLHLPVQQLVNFFFLKICVTSSNILDR